MTRRDGPADEGATDAGVPTFGRREPGRDYRTRPGAYAIIRDDRGRVAVVSRPGGYNLPGGGIDPGEPPADALRREACEECGREVSVGAKLAEAIQYKVSAAHGPVAKACQFYAASFAAEPCDRRERDHQLIWLEPGEAAERLKDEAHRWAVRHLAGE